MARQIPAHRFDDLVNEASEVFIARGYRLTQMSDVATAVGVAKGTLYCYVESKEALFALCLLNADARPGIETPEALPVPTPPPGELAAQIRVRLADEGVSPVLREALEIEKAEDPAAELRAVVAALYDTMERNHRGIKLLDRAVDHPELSEIWRNAGREAPRKAIAQYVEMRIRSGQFRPVPDVALAARMIIEICATWAVHIKWDRIPQAFDPVVARENAILFMLRALLPD
ncbi:MAG: TetR/AcrR family transcriptional regulator [Proteobacteria bacterium]|nr:TetR/AcrR family transcriptional regulator [Pseudomonadota bacterium]